MENRLYEKAEQIQPREFKYVELVKEKFKTLPEAVNALGDSLTSILLANRLSLKHGLTEVINKFRDFSIKHTLLQHAFMSQKGIYYEIKIENMKIIWLSVYPNISLQEVVEIKVDEPKPFKWSELNFLHFASDSEEEIEEEFKPVNNPDKLDVSLLSYSVPFQQYHLELVLFKLNKLYEHKEIKKRKDFEGMKFLIECKNLYEDIKFVIEILSGEIVKEGVFDFCIGEKIDNIVEGQVYVHPQFVFDTLNWGEIDYEDYRIGRRIPKHKSPFSLTAFIDKDKLSTLSKTKRNKLQNIIDGFEDVHYRESQ